jgi:hypothetical protein
MSGALARAEPPSARGSVGTGRQPTTPRPSATHASSTRPRAASSRRNTIASPHHGPGTRLGASGNRTPAPSPVSPSAATAPRWPTRRSPSSAASRIAREARPRTSATKPMPQESRSSSARCSRSPFQEKRWIAPAFCDRPSRRRREAERRLARKDARKDDAGKKENGRRGAHRGLHVRAEIGSTQGLISARPRSPASPAGSRPP